LLAERFDAEILAGNGGGIKRKEEETRRKELNRMDRMGRMGRRDEGMEHMTVAELRGSLTV